MLTLLFFFNYCNIFLQIIVTLVQPLTVLNRQTVTPLNKYNILKLNHPAPALMLHGID